MLVLFISSLIIMMHSCTGNQSHFLPLKWPEIEQEIMVNEYQEMLLSITREKFNTSSFPADVREDANDILIRLTESLDDCQNALSDDHKLFLYKRCVHETMDRASTEIWDFRIDNENQPDLESDEENYHDDDHYSSGVTLTKFVFLIPLKSILSLLKFI